MSDFNQVFEFLQSIEGAGYGGMAEFEIARETMRRAAIAGAEPWHPIETAPKDGTEVLLWIDCLDYVLAKWEDGGWIETWDGQTLAYSPTHWTLLPEAPADE